MAEMFTAFHLDRFIIPCVLDSTPLPQFLGNAAYLDHQRDKASVAKLLSGAIRAAPSGANEVAAFAGDSTTLLEIFHKRDSRPTVYDAGRIGE